MRALKRFFLSLNMLTKSLSFLKLAFVTSVAFTVVFNSSAQIVWTDSFTQFQSPSSNQCNNWTNFLDQLVPSHYYVSVKISGTYDPTGIVITDPVAANQL